MVYEFKDEIENAVIESFVHVEGVAFDELDEVYRKAKSFDELVNFYPQKDEIPSDEFFMMMGYIIEGYKDELKEVHSKAKAFDEIKKYVDKEVDSYMTLYRETKDPVYSLLNSHYDTLLGYIEELERVDNET